MIPLERGLRRLRGPSPLAYSYLAPMSENDLRQLRAVLREAVRASRIPMRQWEEILGLGHGNLQRLLDGSMDLRIRHILGFARTLKVSPGDLLDTGCPEAAAQGKYRTADWIAAPSLQPPHRKSQEAAEAPSPGELKEVIRGILREELGAFRVVEETQPNPRKPRG
jgi:hypothetical protein